MAQFNSKEGILAALFRDESQPLPDTHKELLNDELIEAMRKPNANRTEVFGLMMQGASLSARSKAEGEEGWTPMMYAVDRGNSSVLEVLLHFKASPNDQNNAGDTPLIMAIKKNDDFMFRHIMREYQMDQEIYLNLRNQYGRTALMLAAEKGQKEWVERLLYAGADAMPQDHEGKTAADHARMGFEWKGSEEIAAIIQKAEDDARSHIAAGLPTGKAVSVGKPLSFGKAAAPKPAASTPDAPKPTALKLVKKLELGAMNMGGPQY